MLEGVRACRRKWLCPRCGYRAVRDESERLEKLLLEWTTGEGAVGLLTLTQRHQLGDGLADLWDRLEAGWAAITRGSGWRTDQNAFGLRGYIRVTEVVHHPSTGWNVHFHVLLLLDYLLDEGDLDRLKTSLADRYCRGIESHGGQVALRAQSLQLMRAGTERYVAWYHCKGTGPLWTRDGSRSPIAILSDLETNGEGLELWQEFTAAVTDQRRVKFSASKNIDALRPRCGRIPY
ncbi:protein rep [Mycolicibacter algericus]|uniref:protein rep n=1 Tax=Mycolicibacter algericus TaxID=1288388 RepID=UPI003530580B